MDKTDIQILSHLLNNCRTPDRQIGNSIGISGRAGTARIQKRMDKKVSEEFAEKIENLLQDARLKIEEVAKLAALSTKTVGRSLDKLQNDEAIQFTLVYNPNEMKGYIPFAILVGVEGNVKKTLQILEKEFIGSFLQKPFVNMNQIVLFFYSDNIFKLDELTQMVQKITGVRSVDLFIPKKISFPQQWVKNSIREVKASKRLHLSYQIHS